MAHQESDLEKNGQSTNYLFLTKKTVEFEYRQIIEMEVDLQPLPVYHFKELPEGPFTLFEFNVKFKMKANNRNELSSYLLKWPTN